MVVLAECLLPSVVLAVIVVVPGPARFTFPVESTVATEVSLLNHVRVLTSVFDGCS